MNVDRPDEVGWHGVCLFWFKKKKKENLAEPVLFLTTNELPPPGKSDAQEAFNWILHNSVSINNTEQ